MGRLKSACLLVVVLLLISLLMGAFLLTQFPHDAAKQLTSSLASRGRGNEFALGGCDNSWQAGIRLGDQEDRLIAIDSEGVLCSVDEISPLTTCCDPHGPAIPASACEASHECSCLHQCILAGPLQGPSTLSNIQMASMSQAGEDALFARVGAFPKCMLHCRLVIRPA